MPNMYTFRPCDGNEVAGSYRMALKLTNSPSVLALSRQGMPVNTGTSAAAVEKGAYVMDPSDGAPELIIAATGSEMQLAVEAKAALAPMKVALVSMPCQELFLEQPLDYQLSVFPEGVPVLSVEASGAMGWERFSHLAVGMTRYGASGPIKSVYPKFGFTVENVAAQAKGLLAFYGGKPAPSPLNRPQSSFVVPGH